MALSFVCFFTGCFTFLFFLLYLYCSMHSQAWGLEFEDGWTGGIQGVGNRSFGFNFLFFREVVDCVGYFVGVGT